MDFFLGRPFDIIELAKQVNAEEEASSMTLKELAEPEAGNAKSSLVDEKERGVEAVASKYSNLRIQC